MSRIMWKSFCFPSNLPKPSSSSPPPCLPPPSDDPHRHSILLINNFNLLYDHHSSATTTTTTTTFTASTSTAANSSSSSTSESDNYYFTPGDNDSPPPDLTAVHASRRFFFSSPGRSNSITDSPDLRSHNNYETATTTTITRRLLDGGNAVKQYVQSPDPYKDFRRSMQEMIDAVRNDEDDGDGEEYHRRYEFLHELLLSYLSLNAVDTHKFIIRAFADILVSLLSDGHRIS